MVIDSLAAAMINQFAGGIAKRVSVCSSLSMEEVVQIWHVKTGHCLRQLEGHTGSLWAVAWQPAGRFLASSDSDDTVRIWDADTGERLKILRADRPYEGMNISGATGLSEAQRMALRALGAYEWSNGLGDRRHASIPR